MTPAIPDAFAAAYFAACIVAAGAVLTSAAVVVAHLWRGGK